NALLDLGRFQQAISDYEIVLKEEPANVKTRVNMAIAYSSLRNFAKAEEEFAKAQRHGRTYADLYVNRAIMYFETQQYAKALPDYQRYLELKPDDHQIYNDMGVVYNVMGQYQKAVESFTRAINISPVKDYYRFRAQAYEKLGNTSAAQQDRRMAQ
ncbi:MAG TPA: tetratricopeptide repeat protein, partial [Saprospiraceae bacterium]|nr:tetratricopeptide repeat protein [Saprospiraceae bacterium]